jgi:hypothetical protein
MRLWPFKNVDAGQGHGETKVSRIDNDAEPVIDLVSTYCVDFVHASMCTYENLKIKKQERRGLFNWNEKFASNQVTAKPVIIIWSSSQSSWTELSLCL